MFGSGLFPLSGCTLPISIGAKLPFYRRIVFEDLNLLLSLHGHEGDLTNSEEFAYAPRFGDAAAGRERWIAIKYVGDTANAIVGKVMKQGDQEGLRLFQVIINAQMCLDKWSQEPTPNGALMVSGCSLPIVAAVAADVTGVAAGEGAQPVGGEQVTAAYIDDSFLLFGRQGAVGEGDGEELIGSETAVVGFAAVCPGTSMMS